MLALRIALRYLFSPKSHKAVNVISFIAMAGVAVATAAIVVVLSVFNGFTELSRGHLGRIDPQLKVLPAHGKVFEGADSLARLLGSLPQISLATPTLEERALAVHGESQMPVRVKGVDAPWAAAIADINALIIDGIYSPSALTPDSGACALASVGVAMELRARPSVYSELTLYVPRRRGRINPANPAAMYRHIPLTMTGVFRVDQPEYDTDYMIVPLSTLRTLLDYDSDTAGALELALAPGADAASVADIVRNTLGEDFDVLTREHLQADTFRMISVEKWVTFLMLLFILVVACFNIISTLSLLVIEKRSDLSTMRALGAPAAMIRSIFIREGWLITSIGGLAGAAVGVVLSLLQQHFGFIRLGADPTALTIDVYPVHVEAADILLVVATVLAVGLVIGQISRIFTRKI